MEFKGTRMKLKGTRMEFKGTRLKSQRMSSKFKDARLEPKGTRWERKRIGINLAAGGRRQNDVFLDNLWIALANEAAPSILKRSQ